MIEDEKVILRDWIESDLEKRIYWETEETEWHLWDGPWKFEKLTAEEAKKDLDKHIEAMKISIQKAKSLSEAEKRTGFQICTKENVYIGWCNSYKIDGEYNPSRAGEYSAIGIDIPEISQRGKGYAYHALCLFMDYLREQGETEFYIQTWSGNERVIHLARKLGFEECCRKKGIRTVRGGVYDALTFKKGTQS